MADAQADNAQGQQAEPPKGDAPAPKAEDRIPKERFDEVNAELKNTRTELAAMRQEFAALQAKVTQPQDAPPQYDGDESPEKVFERVVGKAIDPLRGALARVFDDVDSLKFERNTAGLAAEDVAEAERLRKELQVKGVYAQRDDTLALALGRKALAERKKSASDEEARRRAIVDTYAGEERPGSSRPSPEPDFDRLPPEERAQKLAERMGNAPI